MNDLEKVLQSESSRRAFITRMSAAGLGAAAMALLAGCGSGSGTSPAPGNVILPNVPTPSPSATPTTTFFDPVNFPGIVGRNYTEVVLNYALILETLEADLYRQALNLASGRANNAGLDSNRPASGTGGYSQTISAGSGIASGLTSAGFLYLVQYSYVEAAHRDFLRTVLRSIPGAPIANVTAINFTSALGTSLTSILNLIYAVEETGVRAYLGAAPFLPFASETDKATVTTAVAIHSTEARHSAAVAYVLGKDAGPIYNIPGVSAGKRVTDKQPEANASPYQDQTFQYYSDPPVVITAVTPFIASLGVA